MSKIFLVTLLLAVGSNYRCANCIAGCRNYFEVDTFYIRLPTHYDTVNVMRENHNIIAIIFDKYSLENYRAPDGLSLDMQRMPSFSTPDSVLPMDIRMKILDVPAISDSLVSMGAVFLRRHHFFVISAQSNGSYFFYDARAEYLHKEQ